MNNIVVCWRCGAENIPKPASNRRQSTRVKGFVPTPQDTAAMSDAEVREYYKHRSVYDDVAFLLRVCEQDGDGRLSKSNLAAQCAGLMLDIERDGITPTAKRAYHALVDQWRRVQAEADRPSGPEIIWPLWRLEEEGKKYRALFPVSGGELVDGGSFAVKHVPARTKKVAYGEDIEIPEHLEVVRDGNRGGKK